MTQSLISILQDSETQPNTSTNSVAGDAPDGRKRRSDATQLRKSTFGKKHAKLDESKVAFLILYSQSPLL